MTRTFFRVMHEARRYLPLFLMVCTLAFVAVGPCFGQSVLVNAANGASATAVLVARAVAVVLIIVFGIITGITASQGHAGQALMGFAGLGICIVMLILAPQVVTMFTNWANTGAA